MTVRELIIELLDMPQRSEVVILDRSWGIDTVEKVWQTTFNFGPAVVIQRKEEV